MWSKGLGSSSESDYLLLSSKCHIAETIPIISAAMRLHNFIIAEDGIRPVHDLTRQKGLWLQIGRSKTSGWKREVPATIN